MKNFFIILFISLIILGCSIYQNLNNKPKVSVIVPCYNSSEYLSDLFLMLKAQTLKNYELIFVDDGSIDNTNSLIKEQQKHDKRIKLISIATNTGAGNARNVGLKNAIGDFVIFLDSDDIFYPNLLETSYNLAVKYNVDILVFNFECINWDNSLNHKLRYVLWDNPPINTVFSPRDIPDNVFTFSRGVPWNKLFKRDFVIKNNLHFLNTKKHNDSYFVYTAYVMAERIFVTDKTLLAYRVDNKNSITVCNRNYAEESIERNLVELRKFLIDKNLLNIYNKSLEKITIRF